jgi:hypothetical protein
MCPCQALALRAQGPPQLSRRTATQRSLPASVSATRHTKSPVLRSTNMGVLAVSQILHHVQPQCYGTRVRNCGHHAYSTEQYARSDTAGCR